MRMFTPSDFKGVFYAHRGLYNNQDGVPENSLAAFRAAAEKGRIGAAKSYYKTAMKYAQDEEVKKTIIKEYNALEK